MQSSAQINLSSFDEFRSHPWVSELLPRYQKRAALAGGAVGQLLEQLTLINRKFVETNERSLITVVDGRVKEEKSFFRKLFDNCCEKSQTEGLSRQLVHEQFDMISDLAGARFAVPYYDEVIPTITKFVKPALLSRGYATELAAAGYADKNYLDEGDKNGYRSYHFFVKVPVITTIYNDTESMLCEVQARSELQHVWAVKSHDLLYKPKSKSEFDLNAVKEDMRQVGNSLRAADHHLCRIKQAARGGEIHG